MNSEVQKSVRNAYLRATIRRNAHRRRQPHLENSAMFGSQRIQRRTSAQQGSRCGATLMKAMGNANNTESNPPANHQGRGAELLRISDSSVHVVIIPETS